MAGIVICCFMMEIWKYQLGLRLFFQERIQRRWLAFVGIVPYMTWLLFGKMKEEDVYLIMYYTVMGLLFFMIKGNWKKKIEELLLMYFVITCMDSLFSGIVNIALRWHKGMEFAEKWEIFANGIITLAVLLGIAAVNNKKHILEKEKIIQFVRKGMVFLVVFIATEVMLTVTALSFAKEYVPSVKFEVFAEILSGTAYFAAGVLGAFVIYIKNTSEKMERTVETERALKEMQEKYYKALLEKEEETRKYRHDMGNHLICLNRLAQEEHAGKVADYIGGMQRQAASMQKKIFSTGNMVLDSLLNHYSSIIGKDIKLTVLGRIENDLKIADVDLCTVFGNLLQNAVEAVEKIQGEGKYILVQIRQGREYLGIKIENSVRHLGDAMGHNRRDFLKTEKKDKRNHGIGIENVQETVKHYQGTFTVFQEQQKFIAEIVLKNRK